MHVDEHDERRYFVRNVGHIYDNDWSCDQGVKKEQKIHRMLQRISDVTAYLP